MSEQSKSPVSVKTPTRPFPWICPKCRRREVRRATIPYQCERLHDKKPITVVLSNLSVPRCDNCGEVIFDYEAEEQINRAFELQRSAWGNGGSNADAGQPLNSLNGSKQDQVIARIGEQIKKASEKPSP